MAYKKKSNFFVTLFKLLLLILCVAALIGGGVYLYNYFFESETSVSLYINNSKVTSYTGNKLEQRSYTFTLVGADSSLEYEISFKPVGILYYEWTNSDGNTGRSLWSSTVFQTGSSAVSPLITTYFTENNLITYYSNSFVIDFSSVTIMDIIEYYKLNTYKSIDDLYGYDEDSDYIQLILTFDDTTISYAFNLVDYLIRFEESGVIF